MSNSNIVEKYIKYIQNILKKEYIPINTNEINKELTPEVESILIFTYECISNLLKSGDIILFKGSHGMHLSNIVTYLLKNNRG